MLIDFITFLQESIIAMTALSIAVVYGCEFYARPKIPKALDRICEKITQGMVPTNVANILKVRVPGFTEHYRRVPGRMSCRCTPHEVHGEKVYALVIGFKETAASPADYYITIPVYKNGNIYEH